MTEVGTLHVVLGIRMQVTCDECGKTFTTRHRCRTGARWRVGKRGITVRDRTAVKVVGLLRVEVP